MSPTEQPGVVLAAFDLDKTLTTRDCVFPFLWTLGRRRFALGLVTRLPALVSAGIRGDRDRAKTVITRAALAGRTITEVREHADQFAERVRNKWLRPDTKARLAWHVASGHAVVIVSASYDPYVQLLADGLGAHAAIATRIEVGADGRCTGEIEGQNCRGSEKVTRLTAWLDSASVRPNEMYAYGDSAGDRQLLAMADRPFWIGKNRLGERPEGVA